MSEVSAPKNAGSGRGVTNCNIPMVTFCYNKVKSFCEKKDVAVWKRTVDCSASGSPENERT